MSRPSVVITEPLNNDAVAWLAERCDVVFANSDVSAELDEALATAQGLVVRTYTRVDKSLLARAPILRVVGRAGVGLDNIDRDACAARNIAVVSTPDANTTAVVEYIWSLIFKVVRPVSPVTWALTSQEWRMVRDSTLASRELSQMTLGVLGLGRIGSAVARVGSTLMGRVIYHDLLDVPPDQRAGAEAVSRDELLAHSDILTIHVDGRPTNRRLIGADECALLKPDVLFINTSRGFVVDAGALATFLKTHADARAILDVHDPEPFGADYPLFDLRNATLFPHIASATVHAKENMSWVVRDVWRELSSQQ